MSQNEMNIWSYRSDITFFYIEKVTDEVAVVNGFDEKILHIEAQEIVKEVTFAVKKVEISSRLPNCEDLVYLNICTKEDTCYCVELSVRGFQVSTAKP